MLKKQLYPSVWKLTKFLRLAGQQHYRKALRYGVRAAIEHETIFANTDFKTIVDIGANRGQFALVARKCLPLSQIISFEPLAEPAAVFKKLFQEDKSVILHQVAVGPEQGDAVIHISHKDYSSSLLPITELQSDLFPGTSERGQQTIRVERLSDRLSPEVIHTPALLKLDVQGYELETIKGSVDLLPLFSYIYAECGFLELYKGQALASQVIAFLRQKGFHLRGVYNLDYDAAGTAIQGDFLFRSAAATAPGY